MSDIDFMFTGKRLIFFFFFLKSDCQKHPLLWFNFTTFNLIVRVFAKPLCAFFIQPCENFVLLFSCTDPWEQDQLHPVLPQIGLAGQQTGQTGIFIRYIASVTVSLRKLVLLVLTCDLFRRHMDETLGLCK